MTLVGAAGVLPGLSRDGREVRVVFGRVTRQVGRQVSRLGLQELGLPYAADPAITR